MKKDYSWNRSKYVKIFAQTSVVVWNKIINATDSVSANVTNTIPTNVTRTVSTNFHDKKSKI